MSRQEEHWAGAGGDAYVARQKVQPADRMPLLEMVLGITNAKTVLDVGCSEGWNQRALYLIDSKLPTWGLDINVGALGKAREAGLNVSICKAIDVAEHFGNGFADLVIHSGVLIHVPPKDLPATMRAIYDVSRRYVLAIEYDANREEEVTYRGEDGLLWKRPFGMLYEDMGMKVIAKGTAGGYDRCMFWLLQK